MYTPNVKKIILVIVLLIVVSLLAIIYNYYVKPAMVLPSNKYTKTPEELRSDIIAKISATSSAPISTSTRIQILKKLNPR